MPQKTDTKKIGYMERLENDWKKGKSVSLVVGRLTFTPEGQCDNGLPDQIDRIQRLTQLPKAIALQTEPILNSETQQMTSYFFPLPTDNTLIIRIFFSLASCNMGHLVVTPIRHPKEIDPRAVNLIQQAQERQRQ